MQYNDKPGPSIGYDRLIENARQLFMICQLHTVLNLHVKNRLPHLPTYRGYNLWGHNNGCIVTLHV